MGRLLDRLAQRLWVPWLVYIAMAATLALLPSRAELPRLLVLLAVGAFIVITFAGSIRSHLRFSDELTAEQQAFWLRPWLDWKLLPSAVAACLMFGAVEYFDLNRTGIVLPLLASIIVPSQLKERREMDAFAASAHAAD